MNLLGLLPGLLRTVGHILGIGAANDAATAIEGAQMTAEQRAALQVELQTHEEKMKALSIEEMKAAMAESLAMVESPDKYVSRARPTGLYIYYFASLFLTVTIALASHGHPDPTAILAIIGPMAGVGGVYTWAKTKEKLNGNS